MGCPDCLGWGELIVAVWLGVLLGVGVIALMQMAGDRGAVRERDEDARDTETGTFGR